MPQGTPPQDSPWGNFWEYFWQQMAQPNPMWNTPGAGSNISLDTGGGVPISWNNWYWNPAAPPTPWSPQAGPPPVTFPAGSPGSSSSGPSTPPPVASVAPPPLGGPVSPLPPGVTPPGTVSPGGAYAPNIAPGAPPLPPPPPPAPTTNYPAGTNADGSQNWFYWTGPTGSMADPQNEYANTLAEYSQGNWNGPGWYGSNGAYSSSLEGIQGTGSENAVYYDPNYGSGNFVGGGTKRRNPGWQQKQAAWLSQFSGPGGIDQGIADLSAQLKAASNNMNAYMGKLGNAQKQRRLRNRIALLQRYKDMGQWSGGGSGGSGNPPDKAENPNWMGQLVSFNP